ncbi:glutaredoxin family protein [Halobacillus locisalis]|uniref:Glutaredoxin family protein n=1 Tax=Halobacillus locisalis TaxID=220753 RepID=A0A838CV42_9BACI|nr:glutaredoxin family protein [Halobacillus locisalis]MBA2175635.1 glutaredoxin family protein [Halobacillus locisalis]
MNHIVLYIKRECPLCDEVKSLLDLFEDTYALEIEEIDIEQDDELLERFMLEVPVVEINGETMDYRSVDYLSLEKRLH